MNLVNFSRIINLLPQKSDYLLMARNPKRDIMAGVTVAFVALPLALAFGISSGMGAGSGLVTAIVAGVVAGIFGGSNLQISGPTGAMTVVLIPIFVKFGATGVLVVGIMSGILLLILAIFRAGRAMQYLPLPVVEGFTLGIAIIIALQQIPAVLGTPGKGAKVYRVAFSSFRNWLIAPHLTPIVIALSVTAVILIGVRFFPVIPMALISIIAMTIISTTSGLSVKVIGKLPSGLPFPSFPTLALNKYSLLLFPAVAVAILAALESLLSATVADAMSVGERHDPNRELFGQGLANLVVPLFGGIPATAAIARTAVNVRNGAQSRLSAVTQSLALFIVILVASRWVALIPAAALAGVLLATTVQMVEVSSLIAIFRATRGDAAILVATALSTIVFDLVTAVIVGMVIAGVYALNQITKSAVVHSPSVISKEQSIEVQRLLREHVVAYRLDGPLFFGAAHKFLLEISEISDIRVVILRLSRVLTLDATGASVLGDTIKALEKRGVTVLLSGIKDDHHNIFQVLGIYDHLAHENHVFKTTPEAIEHAHSHAVRHE